MNHPSQRPAEQTAIEIRNNFIAAQEWYNDARIYCMCHCHVSGDDIKKYIDEVNEILRSEQQ